MDGFLRVVVWGGAAEETVVVVMAVGVTFVVTDAMEGGGGRGGGTFFERRTDPVSVDIADAGVVARVLGKLTSTEVHSEGATSTGLSIGGVVGVAG